MGKQLLTVLILILLRLSAMGQIITTIAGDGTPGFYGDNGPATDAELKYPSGIAADASGNLYIADIRNYRVRKVDASGVITTFAGKGYVMYDTDGCEATAAGLKFLTNVATDSKGNVYIADGVQLHKVDTAGVITTILGISALLNPEAMVVDSSGNIYVASDIGHSVTKIDVLNNKTLIAGNGGTGFSGDGGPATAASLDYIAGIALDGVGNIYVSENIQRRIRKIDNAGIITTIAGNGMGGHTDDWVQATAASIECGAIALDKYGILYFTDSSQYIRRIEPTGQITTVAGNGTVGNSGDGGYAIFAQLNYPDGLCFDNAGNLYVTELSHKARKISNVGTAVRNVAGNTCEVGLYPNPANNLLTVYVNRGTITDLSISNALGQTAIAIKSSVNNLQVDVSELPAGVYFVKINNTEVRKFVKE